MTLTDQRGTSHPNRAGTPHGDRNPVGRSSFKSHSVHGTFRRAESIGLSTCAMLRIHLTALRPYGGAKKNSATTTRRSETWSSARRRWRTKLSRRSELQDSVGGEMAEVDGNRTRRTGITHPTRFEGGEAHQAPKHLRSAR
jgi:hypothetical protein